LVDKDNYGWIDLSPNAKPEKSDSNTSGKQNTGIEM